AAENRAEAIEAEGDAAVRRGAVFEGFEHVTETGFDHFRRNSQHFFEDGFLHFGLVNTNRAAAEFNAVHNDVIVLATDFFRVGFEQRDILAHGRGKRMMAGIPAILLAVEAEQREFDDPEEIKLIARDGELALPLQNIGAIETNLAENFAGSEPLIGGEQN